MPVAYQSALTPPEQWNRNNDQVKALFKEIGVVFGEGFYCNGVPQIFYTDLTKQKGEVFDMAPFKGRIVLGPKVGLDSGGISPFHSGPVRLTLVRWGTEPEQCERIETLSQFNNTAVVSYLRVKVGAGVLFGPGVTIMDSDGHTIDRTLPDIPANKKMAPVTIEDRAWIGIGSVIMKGVTVGHHAIVAAHAIVTKSVPPHCIVAGNPGKIIKDLTEDVRRRTAST